MKMHVQSFLHPSTETWSYIVRDLYTGEAVVIDPVLDFDLSSGVVQTQFADKLLEYIQAHQLKVVWLLETHIHADHLSASYYLKQCLKAPIGIGSGIHSVLPYWAQRFSLEKEITRDSLQFDHCFEDGETFSVGSLTFRVMHTPGHTPACVSYCVQDCVFVGDSLFLPDVGTARTDFPGGSAKTLYHSIQRLLTLPSQTRMFVGHDYPPKEQRDYACETTVGEQKRNNILVRDGISEEMYVQKREERDLGKPVPKLLYPALQVNIRGGKLATPDENGRCFIRIPLTGPESLSVD